MTRRPLRNYRFRLEDYVHTIEGLLETEASKLTAFIPHNAERGQNDEEIVRQFLRDFLPRRYAIGQGFVVCSDPKIARHSTQTDVIIYDESHNPPFFSGHYSKIFPIEAIFGTIEVKYTLTKRELQRTCQNIALIRRLAKAKRYAHYSARPLTDEELKSRGMDLNEYQSILGAQNPRKKPRPTVVHEKPIPQTLAPRTYIFAFNQTGFRDLKELASFLRDKTDAEAHVHGLIVVNNGWFLEQGAYWDNEEMREYYGAEDNSLLRFLLAVYSGINSLPMGPAAISQYLPSEVIGSNPTTSGELETTFRRIL